MKLRFHKNDVVFSYAQLLGVFFEYGTFLDKHYNAFKTGTIQNNHMFKFDDFEGEELEMNCLTHGGAEEVGHNMLKRLYNQVINNVYEHIAFLKCLNF
jgi:hypothetical protein